MCVFNGTLKFMRLHRILIVNRFPSTALCADVKPSHRLHILQKPLTVAGAINRRCRSPKPLALQIRSYTSSNSSSDGSAFPVEEESVSDESPEEFCPVHIGDIFQEKYKIVGKLGYGTNSTIWLARHLRKNRYVALKIYIRTPPWYSGVNREIRIYEHLSRVRSAHPGQTCIREVIDSFQIMRPDGTRHDCIVHQPLHMSLSDLKKLGEKTTGLSVDVVKRAMKRLFMALDFLHTEARVTHADIKAGNLMITVDDESILTDFEKAEIENPAPGKFISKERTIYVSRDFNCPKDDAWGHFVLCDFGEACIGNRFEYRDVQPEIYKAPEIVLESEWSHSVDIWNAGCVIWDVFQNKHLFDAQDEDGEYSGRYHIAEMIAYIGLPPIEFQKRCKRSPQLFDEDGNWKGYPPIPSISLEESEQRLQGEDKRMFLEFMRSMLRWVPEERKTARELLDDPWLNR